jgi:hypothetical protein
MKICCLGSSASRRFQGFVTTIVSHYMDDGRTFVYRDEHQDFITDSQLVTQPQVSATSESLAGGRFELRILSLEQSCRYCLD